MSSEGMMVDQEHEEMSNAADYCALCPMTTVTRRLHSWRIHGLLCPADYCALSSDE